MQLQNLRIKQNYLKFSILQRIKKQYIFLYPRTKERHHYNT